MMKKYKWQLVISSIVTLLPILFGVIFWNQLPASMTTHWGADGVADGTASKAFIVFGFPVILLVLNWLLLWLSLVVDKRNDQNEKMVRICYSIMPALSLVVHTAIYSVALGKEWDFTAIIPVFLGLMLLVIGNYMPKTTRNRTMGIKLHWTMGNDENWNKTHRLGGKIYFWGGLVVIASAVLPIKIMIVVLIAVIAVSIIVPVIYSYSIYKKHKAEGIEYEPVFNTKGDKAGLWITAIMVPLILVGVGILMVTGNVTITYNESDFQIAASYADDLTIKYDEIDSIEYRESFDIGSRYMGFGSVRLSTGTFQNDEFGRYTLYAYTGGEGAVVLKKGDQVLVIVAKTAAETKMIYDTLTAKMG